MSRLGLWFFWTGVLAHFVVYMVVFVRGLYWLLGQ